MDDAVLGMKLGELAAGQTAAAVAMKLHDDSDTRRFETVFGKCDDIVKMIGENSTAQHVTNQRAGQILEALSGVNKRLDAATSDHSSLREAVLALKADVDPIVADHKEAAKANVWVARLKAAGLVALVGGGGYGAYKAVNGSDSRAEAPTEQHAPKEPK